MQQGFKASGKRRMVQMASRTQETNVLEHTARLWQATKVKCWSGSLRSRGREFKNVLRGLEMAPGIAGTLLCGRNWEKQEFLERFQTWRMQICRSATPKVQECWAADSRPEKTRRRLLNGEASSCEPRREVPRGGGPEEALEAGAVGEAVGHDDVLVEVVGARGAVTFDLIDHLADRKDGGGRGGVGLHL